MCRKGTDSGRGTSNSHTNDRVGDRKRLLHDRRVGDPGEVPATTASTAAPCSTCTSGTRRRGVARLVRARSADRNPARIKMLQVASADHRHVIERRERGRGVGTRRGGHTNRSRWMGCSRQPRGTGRTYAWCPGSRVEPRPCTAGAEPHVKQRRDERLRVGSTGSTRRVAQASPRNPLNRSARNPRLMRADRSAV
jgi:hypothetical protein